jgi:hypothetical protein
LGKSNNGRELGKSGSRPSEARRSKEKREHGGGEGREAGQEARRRKRTWSQQISRHEGNGSRKLERTGQEKGRSIRNEKRSSKIGRGRSGNNWIGRSGSRNWDSIWSVYHRKITKSIKRSEKI